MKVEIKNRFSGEIIFSVEAENWRIAVELAVKQKISLQSADLRYADLRYADLQYADLQSANLQSANLQYADLQSANLRSADLQSADLRYADLRYADLQYANLQSANLRYADLQSADLRYANLQYANLQYANLQYADLQSANLRSAKSIPEIGIAQSRILPEGDIIGWKECIGGVIVKLLIPTKAKRSHAFGRKCRASYVKVIQIFNGKIGISQHDCKTKYQKGKIVKCDKWEEDFTQECAGGIHFFITRFEAEQYNG